MGAGFSRACLEKERSEAVRPSGEVSDECRWVAGIAEDEIEVVGENVSEAMPGERKTGKMIDPLPPSAQEVEEHKLTLLPFRNWCAHCVRGRANLMNHSRQPREERGLDEFHLDYWFPGDEFGHRLTDTGGY